LQDRLGIPTSAGAFDYDLGCSGCIYGLALAKGLIAAGLASNVLLLTAETYSKYLQPKDISNRTIFGDGAAACLISSHGGYCEIGDIVLGTDGSGANDLILMSQGARQRNLTGRYTMDDDGHFNYEDFLYMNGSSIFNFTLDRVPEVVTALLKKGHRQKSDIGFYVFHQANKYMLNTIRKVCGIPKDRFYVDLESTGNTVSSTILIGLKECIKLDSFESGMEILICGFGVGLSYGAALLHWC
jgi:3-oxoacyl-[acyl-carrier-protein] synthase-3